MGASPSPPQWSLRLHIIQSSVPVSSAAHVQTPSACASARSCPDAPRGTCDASEVSTTDDAAIWHSRRVINKDKGTRFASAERLGSARGGAAPFIAHAAHPSLTSGMTVRHHRPRHVRMRCKARAEIAVAASPTRTSARTHCSAHYSGSLRHLRQPGAPVTVSSPSPQRALRYGPGRVARVHTRPEA